MLDVRPVPEREELPWEGKSSYGPESFWVPQVSTTLLRGKESQNFHPLHPFAPCWANFPGTNDDPQFCRVIGSPFQHHWTIHENSTFTASGCAVPWASSRVFSGADPKRMCLWNLWNGQPEKNIITWQMSPTPAWNTQTYWYAQDSPRFLDQYREITAALLTKYHHSHPDRGTVSKDSATGSSVPILSKWCPKTLLPSTSAVMWLWVTRKRNIPGSLVRAVPQVVRLLVDVQVI